MTDWLPPLPVHDDGRAIRNEAMKAAHARFDRGPARWRVALGLGPSRADLHAALLVVRSRAARDNADMREAHVRAKAAEKQVRASRREAEEALAEARAVAAAAYEPGTTTCTKTRLHTVAEAEEFAARTGAALGVEFDVYRCKVCPRHPATGQRFLHVCNRDRRFRGAAGEDAKRENAVRAAQARRRAGNVPIRDSATPAAIARLRTRFASQGETA